MKAELGTDALIDSFEKNLNSISFIRVEDHEYIKNSLKIIADIKQERTRTLETAKQLWKLLVKRSLQDITQNLRGYNELCRYFDEYSDYENLLFALDENHRDHVVHSIWVMLIGFYLIDTLHLFNVNFHQPIGYIRGSSERDEKLKSSVEKVNKLIQKKEKSLWSLIALTHDLGYPIEKTSKANKAMAKMIGNFGFLKQSDFNYTFSSVNQPTIESLLKTLSSRVFFVVPDGFQIYTDEGCYLDCAKSLARLDHGIMSAYLLHMYLDFICEVLSSSPSMSIEAINRDLNKAAEMVFVISILYSIAAHTNENVYWKTLDEMSAFLLLCDELDEFSRYARSINEYEWIRMSCRTELIYTEGSCDIIYTLDNSKISDDIEGYFRKKIGKLHNHLEIMPDGINKFTITCRDIRKAEPIEFYYEKSGSQKEGTLKKTPGKSCNNVQAYLDGIDKI
jgi:hypothetical protein